jgi:hypothetical protein
MKLYELCIIDSNHQVKVIGTYSTLEAAEENESDLKKVFSLLDTNEKMVFIRVKCIDIPINNIKHAYIQVSMKNDNIVDIKITDIRLDNIPKRFTYKSNTFNGKSFSRANFNKIDGYWEGTITIEESDTKETLKQKAKKIIEEIM